MMQRIHIMLVAAAVTSVPTMASAQFASVAAPPKRHAAATVSSPASDTLQAKVPAKPHPATQLPDLTAWVDSAVTAQSALMTAADSNKRTVKRRTP